MIRRITLLLVVGLLGCAELAEAKPIRLRNETIEPPATVSRAAALRAPSVTVTQSGLFLMQFTNAPTAEERQSLAAQGIELLRYVPDDAYIARFRNVPQATSARRGQFVTAYLPRHKLDAQVLGAIVPKSGEPIPGRVRIAVVLAPGLTPVERVQVRQLFSQIRQDNPMRLSPVLRGEIEPAKLQALAASSAVLWIEPDRPMRMHDEVSSKIVAGDGGVNQTLMQSLGFTGSGVTVAVADSGLDTGDATTMHPDLFGRTAAFFYYGTLTDASDEHGHGTHVAGIVAGNGATGEKDDNGALYGLGVAPEAKIIAQRIFDGAGNYEAPASYEQLTRDATEAGAVIGSNSWGDDTQGRYDISASEFDALVRDADSTRPGDQPYILEFSAGNAGPGGHTMDSPAVAKNVIATGACQSDRRDLFIYDTGPDTMADFSSRGPAEDGRIKPDLVAPGTWISSLQSSFATSDNAWSPISQYYQYEGGTSQAGPHASGAAAVFVQWYRAGHTNATPSPALVKAALINSATPMDPLVEVGPAPNGDEGWGRLDLIRLVDPSMRFDMVDQTVLLTNQQFWEHRIVVATSDQPLKITLAYTDVPGLPAAIPALVNDLDLEVVAPDGSPYRGNQFSNGESIPNAPAPDSLNNVEGVYLSVPLPGEYLVRVRARKIVEDARVDTKAVDQDFALVCSANIPLPGQGIITMDRASYTAPSQIKIRLFDSDLAGQSNITVNVRSTTEPNGEAVILKPATATGSFTNLIATAKGTAVTDGKLQIANGDLIVATYRDLSNNTNRTATAVADMVAPVVTNIAVNTDFGSMTVSWTSDEPATSLIYYGTTSTSLKSSLSDLNLATDHTLTLKGLVAGQTYYYYVVSVDEAGNITTNNNNGKFFTFVAVASPPVLLLDAGVDATFFGMPSLSGYTSPLDQLGVKYDSWGADQLGIPSTNTMLNYRAIICRLPELGTALTTSDLATLAGNLTIYVKQGGSLFIATMDGLSRLDDAGVSTFATDVLHVQSKNVDLGVSQVVGTGDPVGAGMDTLLDYSAYLNVWGDWVDFGLLDTVDISDTIVPASDAESVLLDDFGDTVGLRWPRPGASGSGRVVFCSFPLDAVPDSAGIVNNRAALLRSALLFLIPGMNGLATVALDSQSYTVPSRVVFEVDDADLAGLSSSTVTAYSSRQTNKINVTMTPLNTNGAFSGWFLVVSPTNKPAAGQLAGLDGDTIRIDYQDASTKSTVSATAMIDTQQPVISSVVSTPDYQSVTISWTTSEPADSSLQLGASVLFDRAAGDAVLSTYHELSVFGLKPDTEYLFQVSSRDSAGNVQVDDDGGQYYRVRTLLPLIPPWADNFDSGSADGWTTQNGDFSEAIWTLGTPNNGQVTDAHSPPNAWGSNLGGGSISAADSFLISPAFAVPENGITTLHFWHSYDFTPLSDNDIFQSGIVQVVTNSNLGSPIVAATFSDDATLDWEPVDIDLTGYAGQTIFVVWEYQLFSIDSLPRPGWVVDDVSITVSNAPIPSVIFITNNLWEASWTLSGPLATNGSGAWMAMTNPPAGVYTITWNPVTDYITPAPQTNTSAAGTRIGFSGVYTMVDTNNNGIPDSWERRYFGSVPATHLGTIDTDHDGMSDYAEFVAGTNPTNAASVLELTALPAPISGKSIDIQWTYATNRACRVLGSTNAVQWAPVTDWLYNTNHAAVPVPTRNAPYLFKLELRP